MLLKCWDWDTIMFADTERVYTEVTDAYCRQTVGKGFPMDVKRRMMGKTPSEAARILIGCWCFLNFLSICSTLHSKCLHSEQFDSGSFMAVYSIYIEFTEATMMISPWFDELACTHRCSPVALDASRVSSNSGTQIRGRLWTGAIATRRSCTRSTSGATGCTSRDRYWQRARTDAVEDAPAPRHPRIPLLFTATSFPSLHCFVLLPLIDCFISR